MSCVEDPKYSTPLIGMKRLTHSPPQPPYFRKRTNMSSACHTPDKAVGAGHSLVCNARVLHSRNVSF